MIIIIVFCLNCLSHWTRVWMGPVFNGHLAVKTCSIIYFERYLYIFFSPFMDLLCIPVECRIESYLLFPSLILFVITNTIWMNSSFILLLSQDKLDDMNLEEEKKDLINREIDRFRQSYKVSILQEIDSRNVSALIDFCLNSLTYCTTLFKISYHSCLLLLSCCRMQLPHYIFSLYM